LNKCTLGFYQEHSIEEIAVIMSVNIERKEQEESFMHQLLVSTPVLGKSV